MKKSIISLFTVVAGSILLLGCTVRDFTRKDVKSYIKNDLGIKNFELAEEPEEYVGKDNYTDYIWHVKDLDYGFDFTVVNDTFYSGESRRNQLKDDYCAMFVQNYEKPLPDEVKLSYVFYEEDEYTVAKLAGTFVDKAELDSLLEDVGKVHSYYEGIGFNSASIPYLLYFNCPLTDVPFYKQNASIGGLLSNCNTLDYDAIYDGLIMTCLDHRYFEGLEGFSDEYIDSYINTNKDVRRLYQDGQPLNDLIASEYGYGVSFATLYEVLKLNDYDVTGNPSNYSFVGADGSEYAISYFYNDYPYVRQEQEELGYYYMKDGQKTPMEYSFYNHFKLSQVEKMTGINLSDSL